MKKRAFGRIINIASVHGLRASEFKSAYVSAKHGLLGLTKTLALEGAPLGITVNAICPGYVRTALVDRQIENQSKAHGITPEEVVSQVMLKKQAIKDFIPVETIAEMALFLASPRAHTVTGAALELDGGWTAQ
jgi:3-hydroxybutyrate dehydrogenase